MKWIIVLLVLASVSFAQFEELIEAHQSAAQNEDWEAYITTFDTSEMNSSEIESMKGIVEAVWEKYDTEYYEMSNLSSITEGEDALVQYHLKAQITGAEGAEVDEEYFALLHLVEGEWKIVFNMPLSDYLELTESVQKLKVVEKVAEIAEEKEKQAAVEPPGMEVDGEEPEVEKGCLPAFLLLVEIVGLAFRK
ncbi:MAG: hypothetical protein GY852_01480 [bacterium]|nr:hypothetical protein [bacterium]